MTDRRAAIGRPISGLGDFADLFRLLAGNDPFPWQARLFERLLSGEFPWACDIPTGLGKTSVIAVWLLALAKRATEGTLTGFPRRLAYVVNRRTVVDQATREVERFRNRIVDSPGTDPSLLVLGDCLRSMSIVPSAPPLAISTLRGQHADNAEWRVDPCRPAVILGTVDMIGSRLLFSGYGRGFKSRPLHAAFLSQDVLLVHDEAHLEPAFQQLLAAIRDEQTHLPGIKTFRVMALTATSRDRNASFGLDESDRANPIVRERLMARKGIRLWSVNDEKAVVDEIARRALAWQSSGQAILVFVQRVEDVDRVSSVLEKAGQKVERLTGTLRGLERDRLATESTLFARFLPKPPVAKADGTVYLVCTSAGEVGINISGDHLISDLTPFDSMTQRLGRVNRFGQGDAIVDVVFALESKQEPEEPAKPGSKVGRAVAIERTLELLRGLPSRKDGLLDASPFALGALPADSRQAAFTPAPEVLAATDVLFDAWALTTIKDLPGRPPVVDWLHGVAEWEPPETFVAWRREVELIGTPVLLEMYPPEDLLEDFPLKPHELLRDRSDRILKRLEAMAEPNADKPVWVVSPDQSVRPTSLRELVGGKPNLADCTVILPPTAGGLGFRGLESTGIFDGSPFIAGREASYDVSELWGGDRACRCRVWDHDEPGAGFRWVRTIELGDGDEHNTASGEPAPRLWRWFVHPPDTEDEGSRVSRHQEQDLDTHLALAERYANELVSHLSLGPIEGRAVVLAARWHDLGKHRRLWQHSIGNLQYPSRVLAKSGRCERSTDVRHHYRHELGSLVDVSALPDCATLDQPVRDLVFHLIAAHHGRGRPHFPRDEAFDSERNSHTVDAACDETPRRFARLERRYGRWGLAYLESIVRAADALASQPPQEQP